jgi:cytidylate kinase
MGEAAVRRVPRIVAIDGPSGVGKSTAARLLAERLGVPVLDTGAMYRAVALEVLRRGVDPGDREAVVRVAMAAPVETVARRDGIEIRLAGEDVEPHIRTPEVSEVSSRISAYPQVRRRLVELQREAAAAVAAAAGGAVVEGRDIGTVVFPDAPYKFFLDARSEVRAGRRHRDLAGAAGPSVEEVRRDLERRDARDRARADSPLSFDASYELIDTSELSPGEVVERMLEVIASAQSG